MLGGDEWWELDDPFGEGGVFQPVDPRPPGGGGSASKTFLRFLDLEADPIGTWTVRIRNRSQDNVRFTIAVDYPETVQLLRQTRLPFQLINRVFAQAVLALGLRIQIDNGQARIEFDRTFRALTGVEDQIFSVTDRLQDINLQKFTVELINDTGVPAICVGLDLEDRGDELGLPGPNVNIDDLAIVCRVRFSFGYRSDDFFESAMRRDNGRVVRRSMDILAYLDVHPDISGLWASFADAILTVSGSVGLTEGSSIDDYVQSAIDEAEQRLSSALNHAVAAYFQDVIMHLVDRNEVLFEIRSDDDAIVVTHHSRPSPRDFLGQIFTADEFATDATADGVEGGNTTAPSEPQQRLSQLRVTRPRNAELPAMPFLRDGEIDHIVVLMMENRSFDHMLGYRASGRPNVNGLSGRESNPLSGGAHYEVFHLRQTSGIPSPFHDFEATLAQIAGGSMSGFVQNYAQRPGVVDPSFVMGYHTATELPMYEFLANNFAICDAWHSAHPGETQCNRLATLTGGTPELTNFDLADHRLAYYRATTIFDYLSQQGVDWVYAEGNIAFLRMFDRYRIDIQHIIPFRDDFNQDIDDTFENRVLSGHLPSVSFIDPRYIDVPPLWDANDDLPPADVCRGQQLVRRVYDLLSSRPTWERTLLLITYDEHGGFFDHEVPPGMTGAGVPGAFPRLHPEGPQHLGVRVPALVVTPWIDAGTVLHTTFDHTSILKTILQRFAPADYPTESVFGPRAAAANGLLTESFRSSARTDVPVAPPVPCEPPIGPTGPSAQLDETDFHASMRLLGVPAKYRQRVRR